MPFKRTTIRAAGSAAALAALVIAASAEPSPGPHKLSAPAMNWQPLAEGSPVKTVQLWGDRTKDEDYGMLVKLPPGFSTGMHTHSADYDALQIQGTQVHAFKEEAGTAANVPGSYTRETAGHIHNDTCLGPDECIVFIHQNKKFDFVPAEK